MQDREVGTKNCSRCVREETHSQAKCGSDDGRVEHGEVVNCDNDRRVRCATHRQWEVAVRKVVGEKGGGWERKKRLQGDKLRDQGGRFSEIVVGKIGKRRGWIEKERKKGRLVEKMVRE